MSSACPDLCRRLDKPRVINNNVSLGFTALCIRHLGAKLTPFLGLTLLSKIGLLRHTFQIIRVGLCSQLPMMLLVVEVPRKKILERGTNYNSEEKIVTPSYVA